MGGDGGSVLDTNVSLFLLKYGDGKSVAAVPVRVVRVADVTVGELETDVWRLDLVNHCRDA